MSFAIDGVVLTVPVVKVALPVKLPERVVNEPALAVNEPLESLATIVDAPLDEAAVVRALSIVPEDTFEALMPLIAAPLPEKDSPVIAPAANSPLAPRRTIVAPTLLELAVVLAFAIVPEAMFEALMSVSATPLPETVVNEPDAPVITFPAKEPSTSRRTIVEAPLAEAAEVLALSIVPEEMLEALIAVRTAPLPDKFVKEPVVAVTLVELTSVAVITFAVNDPFASLATIVEAPLAEAAVVNALLIVPLVILDALISVIDTPFPETIVNDPVVAVTTLPAKDPSASRKTIVEAPFDEDAVVLSLDIVPELMLEALISVSKAPLPEMLAFIVPVTVTLLAKLTF
jgi:hypothetical protein